MKKKEDKLATYGMVLFLMVFPWISYLHMDLLNDEQKRLYANTSGYFIDFFVHAKAVVLQVVAVLLLFYLGIRWKKWINRENRTGLLFAAFFAGYIVIASLFSTRRTAALRGAFGQEEGMWVLLAYLVLGLAAFCIFQGREAKEILKRGLLILAGITIVLSLIEFMGVPFLKIPGIKYLVTSEKYYSLVESVSTQGYENFVSLTFYNPNYYGGFCLLLFPFLIDWYLRAEEKKEKAILFVLSMGMIFCVYAAKSSTTFYIAIFEFVVLCVGKQKNRKESLKKILLLLVGCLLVFLLINLASHGKVMRIGKNIITNESTKKDAEEKFTLKDIRIEKNHMELEGEQATLFVTVEGTNLTFSDTEGNPLTSVEKDVYQSFEEEEYQMITYSYQNQNLYLNLGYEGWIHFFVKENRIYGVDSYGNLLEQVSLQNRKGEKYYHLFTGRGYVWSLSVGLLKETVLLGKGPGNFAYVCPQNDFVGLLNTHGKANLAMDRPHSMYLQMWIELGGILFFAFLIFIAWVFIRYLTWRKKAEEKKELSWLFLTLFGFLIYAALNDSMLGVTPVVCVYTGILLGNTRKNMEKR